ncbi:CBS domain-containing protein [Corynebacterium sp. H128]|uniref:CBS domain-containing protein n=1 Tax=unclassified Corynebacterium TaxID=2624378 RepID=UPI0030A634C2
MTSRATTFLAFFNDIEAHLRTTLKAKNSDGFAWMVRLAARKQLVTEQQSNILQECAELRNAIVHGSFVDGEPIADPREDAISTLSAIRDALVAPVTALQILGPKPVQHLSPTDSILEALRLIQQSNISQFPLYHDGKFAGLLTTNTIARWVANDLDDDNRLDAKTVADALKYAEHSEHVEFFSRDTSATSAVAKLMHPDSAQFGLITETGRPHETPLRAIGRSDLSLLHAALYNEQPGGQDSH